MNKPNVYVRADGNPEIGLGHLVRCIALAHMLKDDFSISFVCATVPQKIKEDLNRNKFEILEIEDVVFPELLSEKDIVVLDGYHFDTEYQKKIKATGARLVCIDDLHDKEFVADLIINHAPGVKPQDYNAQPYTKYALGFKHVLLRPSFLNQAYKDRTGRKADVLMICFGGSDYKNLTEKVLQVVLEYTDFKKIIVVTGAAYNYLDSLNGLLNKNNRIVHYHAVEEREMLTLMEQSDIAIVPASGVLLEIFAVGCRVVFGYYAENQRFFSDYLKESITNAVCLDDLAINLSKLSDAISTSLQSDMEWLNNIRKDISQSKENNLNCFRQLK